VEEASSLFEKRQGCRFHLQEKRTSRQGAKPRIICPQNGKPDLHALRLRAFARNDFLPETPSRLLMIRRSLFERLAIMINQPFKTNMLIRQA
jgi:hypothetical protein